MQQLERQPKRAARSACRVTATQTRAMGPRPQTGALVVPPEQVGGHRQPLEVLDAERTLLVSDRQLGVGVNPRLATKRVATQTHSCSHGHVHSYHRSEHSRDALLVRSAPGARLIRVPAECPACRRHGVARPICGRRPKNPMAVVPPRRAATAGWVRREVRIRARDNAPAEPAHRVFEAPNCRACVSKHSTSHVDVLDAPNDGDGA